MPEIGLNGLLLDSPNSGTAVYTRNLVRHLPDVAPDLTFRLFVRGRESAHPRGIQVERLHTPFRGLNHGHGVGARLDKLAWETVSFPVAGARHGERLLHSLYFASPPLASCPVVVTIHDLVPLIFPGYHRTRQSHVYARFMAWSVRRAAAIIAVSEHARGDILKHLNVEERTVHVTPEAADERFTPAGAADEPVQLRRRYRLPSRFFLYLGSAEKRKNLELLVRAWKRASARMRDLDVTLVIASAFPPADALYPDIPRLVRELGMENDVTFLAHIDEDDKAALYRAALGFCFPSRYEGFGLPPLEAMACGTPVLASSATSLPEVVGDGGILLPDNDEAAWAEAIYELAASDLLRDRWRAAGLENARRFSWRRTAEQTAGVYRLVLGS